MADDILTIALEGEVTLADFSEAMKDFGALVAALSQEIGGPTKIDWRIDDLTASSAIATVRGDSPNREIVEAVVRAMATVGTALQHREPIPYSEKVRRVARRMRKRVKGSIDSIRLETPFSEAIITREAVGQRESLIAYTFGQVKGTVQTLTNRGGLRFTLYDSIFDKPISCYLDEGQEHIMRGAWGRKVIVSGSIGRESEQKRPVVVRHITQIDILDDTPPGSYRDARGVIPYDEGNKKPEMIIRGIRDAW
jgi:hypothetical protein